MIFQVEDKLSFDCPPLDLFCSNLESQAQGMSTSLEWLADKTLGGNELAPGTSLWDTAIGQTGYWFGIAIIVSLGIAVIGVAMGVLSFSKRHLWMTIIGICAGIPSTYVALTIGGGLLSISDDISNDLLDRLGGEDGFMNVIRATQQLGTGSDLGGYFANAGLSVIGSGLFMPTAIVLIILILGMVITFFALAFRNFALMILIAFAPLAFMAVSMRGGWAFARKWALAFIALLIAKPLMFGLLAMLLSGAKPGESLFSGTTLTLAIGMIIVGFMPLMAFSFFSFLGTGSAIGDQVGTQVGAKVASSGRAARSAVTRTVGGGVSRAIGGRGGTAAPAARGGASAPSAKSTSAKESSKSGGTESSKGGGTGTSGAAPPQPKVPEPPAATPRQSKPPAW